MHKAPLSHTGYAWQLRARQRRKQARSSLLASRHSIKQHYLACPLQAGGLGSQRQVLLLPRGRKRPRSGKRLLQDDIACRERPPSTRRTAALPLGTRRGPASGSPNDSPHPQPSRAAAPRTHLAAGAVQPLAGHGPRWQPGRKAERGDSGAGAAQPGPPRRRPAGEGHGARGWAHGLTAPRGARQPPPPSQPADAPLSSAQLSSARLGPAPTAPRPLPVPSPFRRRLATRPTRGRKASSTARGEH